MLPAGDVIFGTDCCMEHHIKLMERRRGSSEKLLLRGPVTKKPLDLRQFLLNYENKKQLTDLLLVEWQNETYSLALYGCKATLICNGKVFPYTT